MELKQIRESCKELLLRLRRIDTLLSDPRMDNINVALIDKAYRILDEHALRELILEDEYADYSIRKLRELAAKAGVTHYSRMSKCLLISILKSKGIK